MNFWGQNSGKTILKTIKLEGLFQKNSLFLYLQIAIIQQVAKKNKKKSFFLFLYHKNVVLLHRSIHKIDNLKNYKKMKKVMFVLAVAGMFAFAACNNQTAEATEDTTAAQTEEVAPEATEEQTEATDAEAEATEGVAEENAETQEAAK
ncbi:MAG: hypothetical protein J6Z26_03470 [Bacteroidales bacterium]|nr:hypothetical protein [Bacteroidales bacterium]